MKCVFVLIVLLACVGCLSAKHAQAAFVLDDFDDAAMAAVPEMKNIFVDTANVGALGALRSIRIAGLQGDPVGSLDSNVSSASFLTGSITNLNPVPLGSTIAAVQSNYTFPASDFTQGGINNAFFFDFQNLTSEIPPAFFMILVNDTHNNFVHIIEDDLRASTSFTITVPFDAFTVRGGTPGLPDVTSIQSLNLELRASNLTGGGPDPLDFQVQLDRIRVGRIPEPEGIRSMVAMIFVLANCRIKIGK